MLAAVRSKLGPDLLARYRQRIAARDRGGRRPRHDEPEIYSGEPGDPGLCGPGSLSWEIHGDLASLVVGGTAAILMEVLHPSVMAGVFTHSSYRTSRCGASAQHARLRAAHDLRQHLRRDARDRRREAGARPLSTARVSTASRTTRSIPS